MRPPDLSWIGVRCRRARAGRRGRARRLCSARRRARRRPAAGRDRTVRVGRPQGTADERGTRSTGATSTQRRRSTGRAWWSIRPARCRARRGTLRRGTGVSPFLFAIVGTGASACLVVDGRPYAGGRGEAVCSVRHRSRPWRAAPRSPALPVSSAPRTSLRIRRMCRSSTPPRLHWAGCSPCSRTRLTLAGRPRGRAGRAARLPRAGRAGVPSAPRVPPDPPASRGQLHAHPGRWCGRRRSCGTRRRRISLTSLRPFRLAGLPRCCPSHQDPDPPRRFRPKSQGEATRRTRSCDVTRTTNG